MQRTLRIGDEWNAISLLARSQPDPLKALAELVENAIDAKAETIRIVRGRRRGVPFVSLYDDGRGLELGADGEPDFDHVATHICDSMKRRLSSLDRSRVQGEYGIGLLGFWTLGRELSMVAKTAGGLAREMRMREGEQSYSVGPPAEPSILPADGVEVTVRDLHPTTKHLLTGEKIQRFLATELGERLRRTSVRIEIDDRIGDKRLEVKPHAFSGERIERVRQFSVPGFGTATVDLYLDLRPTRRTRQVWVARKGTRIADDIRKLPGGDRAPWNRGVLAGVIDFPALSPSPGTRQGVVPDAAYTAFMQALESVGHDLEDLLDRRAKVSAAETNRAVAREVRRALMEAMNALPADDYTYFDTHRESTGETPLVTAATRLFDEGESDVGGPLASARIRPAQVWVPAGGRKAIRLEAFDDAGRPAAGALAFSWRIETGDAEIEDTADDRATIRAGESGEATLAATVTDGARTVNVTIPVTIGPPGRRKQAKLPYYELAGDPAGAWRSRYVEERNAIVINSSHPDFVWSQAESRRQYHYLTMLYCKELVLKNFPDDAPEEQLDRMAQLASRLTADRRR